MPPKDVRKEGYIWKLKNPLYGLNDASQNFWLKVKNLFKEVGSYWKGMRQCTTCIMKRGD